MMGVPFATIPTLARVCRRGSAIDRREKVLTPDVFSAFAPFSKSASVVRCSARRQSITVDPSVFGIVTGPTCDVLHVRSHGTRHDRW